MNRRELLWSGLAMTLAAPSAGVAEPLGLREAAREAWLYGLPLIEMASTRARALGGRSALPATVNRFAHTRRLADASSRAVTSPNNDTLYSSAWLDLTQGPVTLTIPATGSRYISVAGMSLYTDNDFILGTRTSGGGGGRYRIVGPGQPGSGPEVVRLTTPHGWLLARVLVDGPDDLPAVHAVQDALSVTGSRGVSPLAYATRGAPAVDYFTSMAALLKSAPPPATDGALFARIAALGLTAQGAFDPARFDAAGRAQIDAGVADARRLLTGLRGGAAIQGWTYPPTTLGFYNQDYAFRAAVALSGLAALPPAEAMYLNPVGDQGRLFTRREPMVLRFLPGQAPPVDGFWSLTMYEATPEGQFFLTPNPPGRFSIGDRTPDLRRNADGSLAIWIAREDPGGERSANWLPAPVTGPYSLSFRAYLPKAEFRDGRYRLPALAPA